MRAPRRGVRVAVSGALPSRARRSNAGRMRVDSPGNTRTDPYANDETRSTASTAHISRRRGRLLPGRWLLCLGQRPRFSRGGFVLVERPRSPSVPLERSDRVAVGTDQLALRDLIEDLFMCPANPRSTDVAELLGSRKVIPLHDLGIEHAAAISARLSGLQVAQPPPTRHCVDGARCARNASADLQLVARVANLSGAVLAIDLQAIDVPSASIEPGASLHHRAA